MSLIGKYVDKNNVKHNVACRDLAGKYQIISTHRKRKKPEKWDTKRINLLRIMQEDGWESLDNPKPKEPRDIE